MMLAAILVIITVGMVMVMKRSMSTGPGSIDAREAAAVGNKPAPARKPTP